MDSIRSLNKIKTFTNKDVIELFKKNNLGEFEWALVSRAVTGEVLLNLSELELLRWKLTNPEKRKILHFLQQIKTNPNVFVDRAEIKTLTKHQSVVQPHSPFKKKLELMIGGKAVNENKSKKTPTETFVQEYEVTSAREHYDEGGYLKPDNNIQENDYEPPPSLHLQVSLNSSAMRKPQTHPRASTDDRGYIIGPAAFDSDQTAPPPLMPRFHSKPVISNLQNSATEDVQYEAIDSNDAVASKKVTVATASNPNLSKVATNCRRKNSEHFDDFSVEIEKLKTGSLEHLNTRSNLHNFGTTPPSGMLEQMSLRKRPLPPLPKTAKEGNDQLAQLLGKIPATQTQQKTNKAQKRHNYELFLLESNAQRTRPLPLPPNSLPPLPLDPILLHKDSSDEERQDYSNIIKNLNDEPFYRNTDRKGARLLLVDLDDGAFLFRNSRRHFLTLSLMYKQQCFNLGIERTPNNKIRLVTEEDGTSPVFSTLSELVAYFTQEKVSFRHNGHVIDVYLRTILPPNRF